MSPHNSQVLGTAGAQQRLGRGLQVVPVHRGNIRAGAGAGRTAGSAAGRGA